MNETQWRQRNLVNQEKERIRLLERGLELARHDLRDAQLRLQTAIDADLASWHDTPGILK